VSLPPSPSCTFYADYLRARYDIVSYGFDDLDAVYLRGQWTIHRNDAEKINQVWRQCGHLGADLQKELGYKVSYLRQMEVRRLPPLSFTSFVLTAVDQAPGR
jgi:hypothetical protein